MFSLTCARYPRLLKNYLRDPCGCNYTLPDTVSISLSNSITVTTCNSTNYTYSGNYILTKTSCVNYSYTVSGNWIISLDWINAFNTWVMYLQNLSYDCHTNSLSHKDKNIKCNPTGIYLIDANSASCGPCTRDRNISIVVS